MMWSGRSLPADGVPLLVQSRSQLGSPVLVPEWNSKPDEGWLRFAARQVYRADAGGTLGAGSAKAVMAQSCHRFGSSFAG
jgi:hypothetical protein